ncbi:MAG TPA: hypothetical protein VM432_12350 [Bdellovibrionales bacterium]|nr:hypothetical protein [Bdellovibrionales bacterium]
MRFLILTALLFISPFSFADRKPKYSTLKTFESDGCTGFVEGTREQPKLWAHCCFEHDLRYWFGGSEENFDHSDLELRSCVDSVAGDKWANLIYRGVRAGHASPVKSKYHWAWGWLPKRNKVALSPADIVYVESELRKLSLEPAYVDAFIEKYLRN